MGSARSAREGDGVENRMRGERRQKWETEWKKMEWERRRRVEKRMQRKKMEKDVDDNEERDTRQQGEGWGRGREKDINLAKEKTSEAKMALKDSVSSLLFV